MKFKLIEPFRELFKDEVRQLGLELGLPEDIVWRQPFPGPGLAIRIIGAVTAQRLAILREADAIVREKSNEPDYHESSGNHLPSCCRYKPWVSWVTNGPTNPSLPFARSPAPMA